MTNHKTALVSTLENDVTLTSLLGGKRIYFYFAPDNTPCPYITYYELNNTDAGFADDVAISTEVVMVIDIWAKGSTTAIFERVDFLMKQLGYIREYAGDLYEPDTGVHHKTTRYRKIA